MTILSFQMILPLLEELEEGLRITKEVMEAFKEKNNDDKEEEFVFGTEEGENAWILYLQKRRCEAED